MSAGRRGAGWDVRSARADLVALLRCPVCDAELDDEDETVRCSGTPAHRFPIVGGVAVLIADADLQHEQYAHQRRHFDREFRAYGTYRLEEWRQSFLDRLRRYGALGGPGRRVVDVGVGGSGYTVIEAAREGALAIGCDLSFEGLQVAARFAEQEGVADRTLFVCCSAERLPLATGAFDAALAIAVIEHVPDHVAAMREIARVLRPGGRTFITVPHAFRFFSPLLWPAWWLYDRRLGHLRRFREDDLVALATVHALQPIALLYTGKSLKLIQVVASLVLRASVRERVWWWIERHDLARAHRRYGSAQLTLVAERLSAPEPVR